MTKTEKLARAIQAIRSNHVQGVVVSFEYSADEFRYYTAITRHTNKLHKYTVRVWEQMGESEMETWARCNCAAGAKQMICRHVLRVAEIDAIQHGREIHPDNIANYSAFQHYQKAKAA